MTATSDSGLEKLKARAEALLEEINEIRDSDPENARALAEKVIELAESNDLPIIQARGLIYLSHVTNIQKSGSQAIRYARRAIEMLENTSERTSLAKAYNNLGNCLIHCDQTPEALQNYTKSLEIYHELQDRRSECSLLNNSAIAYSKLGLIEKAFKSYMEVIGFENTLEFAEARSCALINISEMLMDYDYPDKAKGFLDEALQLSIEMGRKVGVAFCLQKLGRASILSGNYDEAEDYLNRALKTCKELKSDFLSSEALRHLADLNERRGRLDEAERFLLLRLQGTRITEKPRIISNAQCDLALLRIKMGKLDGAQEVLEDHFGNLTDSPSDLAKKSEILSGLSSLHEQLENYRDSCRCYHEKISIDQLRQKKERRSRIDKIELQTEFERSEREREMLREKAMRDSLTGLYNRNYLSNLIKSEREKAKDLSYSVKVLMVDVDRFKEVNDMFGHSAGDLVLRKVSGALQDALRQSDTIFRYGGDEFLVFLPNLKGEIDSVINRVRRNVSNINLSESALNFPITLSIGASIWHPSSADRMEDVIGEADRRMYRDKKAKKI